MQIPSVLAVIAAVPLALPLGWGLGVDLAYAIAGPEFGQLPAGTIPLCIVCAILFALVGPTTAQKRLAIMAAATVLSLAVMMLLTF
jgi:hypothetical protein